MAGLHGEPVGKEAPSVAFGDSSPGNGGAESRCCRGKSIPLPRLRERCLRSRRRGYDADSFNAVPPNLESPTLHYQVSPLYSKPSRAFFSSHSAFSRLLSLARGLPVRRASISRPVNCMAFRR
jgi:hypothetical protein